MSKVWEWIKSASGACVAVVVGMIWFRSQYPAWSLGATAALYAATVYFMWG